MTPLFRSYASSINSTNVVNPAEVETVINREYANRDNNLKGKVSEPVSRSYGYTYPVPGTAPYFNPARSSLESNQATMGLNGSNEQMMWNSPASVDWNATRNLVERNYVQRQLDERIGFSDKEVMPIAENGVLPHEIEIRKRGVLGKLKLAFSFLDNKINSSISNMDKIAVKYHDVSKRKFFWVVWERKSGNYESYQDFKSSWDPNTGIWEEIKKRTNRDVQADVEGVLGLGKKVRGVEFGVKREIKPSGSNVRAEVHNLVRDKQPFVKDTSADISNYNGESSANMQASSVNKELSKQVESSHSKSRHHYSKSRHHHHHSSSRSRTHRHHSSSRSRSQNP